MYVPWFGALACLAARGSLAVFERLRFRRRWQSRFDFLWTYSYARGLRDSLGSMDALCALREDALPPMTQQIDVARALAPQVERLNIDVPSRLVVVCAEAPVGTIDLRPNLAEPLLPWLVREVSARLSDELLLEFARAALLREPEDTRPDTRILGTG
jgi:hypothetical protein